MTSSKKIRLTAPGHLTREELEGYRAGTLPDRKRHEVEMHLLDCRLCSEAVTGISGMKDPTKLSRITHELHFRAIRNRIPKKPILSRNLLIAIIATLLLLCLIALIGIYLLSGNVKF